MRVQNWGWLWIGALVACDPASGSETETESTSGADEMAGRTALPASDAAWRSADASAESARWTGGPGWAGESEGEDGYGEVDDPGAFGEEDQFSWEVFGEIQVQDGQPVGGEGGFYFLVGPPEGPQETLCSVYFTWEPAQEEAPPCALCEGTLSVSIVAAEEDGFLCYEFELQGANFLGDTLHIGLPGDDMEGFYMVDDGWIEQGLDPWRPFTGYGAFEGEAFVMDGIAILE